MILKKPYAFIIKYFKLIHFLLTLLIAYLIYRTNLILSFVSNYISSNTSVVGRNLTGNLFNSLCFIFPIFIIIFALIFIGIMYKKEKPVMFYVINIFIYIFFLVTLAYSYSIIKEMQIVIVDIRPIKIIHDLLIILMGLEVISFVIFLVRALGFDIKKFDFLSDVNKLDINESDKEEFEFDINIDFDEKKRRAKRRLRYLKYAYVENKLFVNLMVLLVVSVGAYFIYSNIDIYKKTNSEKTVLSLSNFNIGIEESYLTNKDYLGKQISDDKYLVIAKLKVKAYATDQKMIIGDFKLNINSIEFKVTDSYATQIKDLGETYTNQELNNNDYSFYIIAFEIPQNLINSDMILSYQDSSGIVEIKLNPIKIDENIKKQDFKLNDTFTFKESILGDIKLKISSYEFSKKFKIEYNFKSNKGDIYPSIEYITPNIDSNYDKVLLKVTTNLTNEETNSNINNFKNLIGIYGIIKYKIDNKIKYQKGLTLVNSTKIKQNNIYYIEANEEITKASNLSLVFKVRNYEYEYILF